MYNKFTDFLIIIEQQIIVVLQLATWDLYNQYWDISKAAE
jgi:hypothetical protein